VAYFEINVEALTAVGRKTLAAVDQGYEKELYYE
jgi:hypothetical protein